MVLTGWYASIPDSNLWTPYTKKKIERALLFLRLTWLSLPSTPICHQNETSRKRTTNRRKLKTPRSIPGSVSCGRKTCWKQRFLEKDGCALIIWFPWSVFSFSNTNPTWSVIAAFLNSCGVVCMLLLFLHKFTLSWVHICSYVRIRKTMETG